MVDYLHRVGRTGRVGSTQKCQAIAFMTRVRDVKMAWTIKVMLGMVGCECIVWL